MLSRHSVVQVWFGSSVWFGSYSRLQQWRGGITLREFDLETMAVYTNNVDGSRDESLVWKLQPFTSMAWRSHVAIVWFGKL